jgi:hypothetical protein
VNDGILEEIKLAYQTQTLVPIKRRFLFHEGGVDYACPVVCLTVHRGIAEKTDPELAMDKASNMALEWASKTFGEDFIWGFMSAWDGQEMVKADSDYLRGYDLGIEAVQQLRPRDPPA